MDCGQCGATLAAVEEILFYCKSEKDVFLTIKPECIGIVKNRSLVEMKNDGSLKQKTDVSFISMRGAVQFHELHFIFTDHVQSMPEKHRERSSLRPRRIETPSIRN